jgi:hypothetical protein
MDMSKHPENAATESVSIKKGYPFVKLKKSGQHDLNTGLVTQLS